MPYSKPNHPEIPTSSSWVTSMALAAEAAPIGYDWELYPYAHNYAQRSSYELQHFAEPVAVPVPHPAPPPVSPPAPASVALDPPPTIGMKPDHDPSSKHGVFVIPSGTSKGPADASSSKAGYIPNPARTLVMEQLPKSHRTQDFVNNWSKSACGAYPVFLCIDSHGAKALVEFATAELARKAWSSPRLGAELVGVKTHHLKGRPREDLIKVWWYRVDGVGANAGVGEIEEGEIEGDAAEKEIEVPVKKESKKEKKARLNRERLAKKASLPAKPPISPPQKANVSAPASNEVVTHQSVALSPNPILYSPELNNGYPYYTIIPQPLPHPLPQQPFSPMHIPPQPPRAPLLPQSALETQWRPKHGPPKKPSRETIITPSAIGHDYTAPIIITSSRSPSPAQHAPQLAQAVQSQSQTQSNPPFSPVYEDMDIDVDMELESPIASRRAILDFSSVPSPPAETLPPSPLMATELVPVAIPNSSTPPATATFYPHAPSHFVAPSDNPLATIAPLPLHGQKRSHTTPLPPAPIMTPSLSSSGSGTLPLEPRAMKNAPKGPSYAKRSLIARQKELEERIAKSKMELGIVTTSGGLPVSSIEPSTPMIESLVGENEESDKLTMEEKLRLLVLRSQKNKSRNPVPTTQSTDAPVLSPLSPALSTSPTVSIASATPEHPASVSPTSSTQSQTFSLEDLAVSFITETIETFKATPNLPTAPLPTSAPAPVPTPAPDPTSQTSNSATTMKLELAAKQKRLEAQIAESKVLMAKLTKARTKHERETILAAMREQSRSASMLEDGNSSTTASKHPQAPMQMAPNLKMQLFANTGNTTSVLAARKWPESHEHAGVLIVSDDEEGDESDCYD
ncbi:hypothetical protein C0991_006109 [Blastosporella zonata]|nr:hypothetical protein C0991_006109 [Blastosporella zonata]